MSGKDILHELDAEALIALATKQATADEVLDQLTEAAKFIYEKGIKHGKKKVPSLLVYYTYTQWKITGKKQTRPIFLKDFNKYFTPDRDKDGTFYLLNEKPFDFSKEAYWLSRKQLRDQRAKNQKK